MTDLYTEVLVAYDIEETKIRNKIFDKLKDFGLRPIQKSVFWGKVNLAERRAIFSLFKELIGPNSDRVIITNINLSKYINTKTIGHPDSDFLIEDYGTI